MLYPFFLSLSLSLSLSLVHPPKPTRTHKCIVAHTHTRAHAHMHTHISHHTKTTSTHSFFTTNKPTQAPLFNHSHTQTPLVYTFSHTHTPSHLNLHTAYTFVQTPTSPFIHPHTHLHLHTCTYSSRTPTRSHPRVAKHTVSPKISPVSPRVRPKITIFFDNLSLFCWSEFLVRCNVKQKKKLTIKITPHKYLNGLNNNIIQTWNCGTTVLGCSILFLNGSLQLVISQLTRQHHCYRLDPWTEN